MSHCTLTCDESHPGTRSYCARTAPRCALVLLLGAALVLSWTAAVLAGWLWLSLAAVPLLVLFLVSTLHTSETVTLLPSLGIQLSSTRRATLPPLPLASSTVLIPLERIAKVVINEGLHVAGGKAYLAVVERGGGRQDKEGKVHVVFPSLLPRLEDLLPVWKSAQALLEQ